jgi:hypothetical protein
MRVIALSTALAAATLMALPCSAAAAASNYPDYPARPIRVLAGGAAAGPIDIMARVVAIKLSEQLGQTIVIDNRGGAGGTIATRLAAQSTADGYTLLCNSSQFAVAASLYRQPGYDPHKDATGRNEEAARCSRLRPGREHARTVHRLHQDRSDEVGEGDQGLGRAGGLATRPEQAAAACRRHLLIDLAR